MKLRVQMSNLLQEAYDTSDRQTDSCTIPKEIAKPFAYKSMTKKNSKRGRLDHVYYIYSRDG